VKCVVCTSDFIPMLEAMKEAIPSVETIVLVNNEESHDGCLNFDDLIKTSVDGVNFLKGSQIDTKKENALILCVPNHLTVVLLSFNVNSFCEYECDLTVRFSSGTTGLPKGVELTHFNVSVNMR